MDVFLGEKAYGNEKNCLGNALLQQGRLMMCFNKTRLAMLAMPKTGCNWVHHVMGQQGFAPTFDGVHAHDLDRLWFHHDKQLFCVLRRPSSWLHSLWKYTQRKITPHPPGGPVGVLTPAFGHRHWEDFLEVALDRPQLIDGIYRAYASEAKWVISTENIAEGLCAILESQELPHHRQAILESPRQNTSPPELEVITDNQRCEIDTACHEAMRLWLGSGIKQEA